MKSTAIALLLLASVQLSAQDHFSGINTSQRVGIQNANVNPAELINLSSKYEFHIISFSVGAANNKVGFSDMTGDRNFEDLIFTGNENADLRFDGEIVGPSFAWKMDEWGFAVTSKAFAKLNLIDIDVNIGDAISNSDVFLGSTTIDNNSNQRLNGTTWGEVGFSAARKLYDSEKHRISVGGSIKLLFPGSYANFGADEFHGTISNGPGSAYLQDAHANLNITYSGNLANNFTNFNDYFSSLFGGLNGIAADLGANYQLKGKDDDSYLLNAGISVRNIGGMTFKDNNNASTNYVLDIPPGLPGEGLDLSQFDDTNSLEEVESILLNSGYLNRTTAKNTDFKVKLPTVLSLYADVKVVRSFYVTLFAKQKMNQDDANDQIASQNVLSLTPRYVWNNVELWSNWSSNEVSGITGGLGFRAYGFYIGSGSAITALLSDAKQGDVYLGYSFGLK